MNRNRLDRAWPPLLPQDDSFGAPVLLSSGTDEHVCSHVWVSPTSLSVCRKSSLILGYAPQETLHDVILAFSRDPWVLRHSEVDLHDLVPIGDEAREDEGGLWSGGQGGCCPPCGVQVRFA